MLYLHKIKLFQQSRRWRRQTSDEIKFVENEEKFSFTYNNNNFSSSFTVLYLYTLNIIYEIATCRARECVCVNNFHFKSTLRCLLFFITYCHFIVYKPHGFFLCLTLTHSSLYIAHNLCSFLRLFYCHSPSRYRMKIDNIPHINYMTADIFIHIKKLFFHSYVDWTFT